MNSQPRTTKELINFVASELTAINIRIKYNKKIIKNFDHNSTLLAHSLISPNLKKVYQDSVILFQQQIEYLTQIHEFLLATYSTQKSCQKCKHIFSQDKNTRSCGLFYINVTPEFYCKSFRDSNDNKKVDEFFDVVKSIPNDLPETIKQFCDKIKN